MDEIRLIDANALQKKCIEGDGNDKFTEGYNFAVQEISAYIVLAPTIDAQPVKHGKWYETHCDLICGVCKWEYSDELPYMSRNGYDSYYEAFAFCPHCGSRLSPPDGAVYEIEDFGGDKNGDQV